MNFDRVAPYYRWLEVLVFGRQLQTARIAFVRQIASPQRVLIVGEGDGRFLAEFVRAHPGVAVDCVETSARMIGLAQARLGQDQVRFIREDVRSVTLPAAHYDLIVTHFVLDCFSAPALGEVVARLAHAATPEANWLLADFAQPAAGWKRWHARFWLWLMYGFFRLTSRIETGRLIDPSSFLCEAGFTRRSERPFRFGMIKSDWWSRRR